MREEPRGSEALSEGVGSVREALDITDGRDAEANELAEGLEAHVPLLEARAGVIEYVFNCAFAVAEDFRRGRLGSAELAEEIAVIAQRSHDVAERDGFRVGRVVGDVDESVFRAGEAVAVEVAI